MEQTGKYISIDTKDGLLCNAPSSGLHKIGLIVQYYFRLLLHAQKVHRTTHFHRFATSTGDARTLCARSGFGGIAPHSTVAHAKERLPQKAFIRQGHYAPLGRSSLTKGLFFVVVRHCRPPRMSGGRSGFARILYIFPIFGKLYYIWETFLNL
jgi:hypothetical protein